MPLHVVLKVEGYALKIGVNGPAVGQSRDIGRARIIRVVLHQGLVGGLAVVNGGPGAGAPDVGVLHRVLVVDAENASVNRVTVEVRGRLPVRLEAGSLLGAGH